MAADSLNVFGSQRVQSDNSKALKIRRVGSALLAITGWFLYDNIIEDLLAQGKTPPLNNQKEIFSFFVGMWRELHERYSFVNDQAVHKDTPFGDLDASFLIANREGIFKVSSDTSVCRFDKYYAIGSGGDYALGALYQLYDRDGDHDAGTIARLAAQTAIGFDIYCGGEIDLIEVK